MDSPSDLRAAAARYRQMTKLIADPRTIVALDELAAEYEAKAAQLEARWTECASCATDFR